MELRSLAKTWIDGNDGWKWNRDLEIKEKLTILEATRSPSGQSARERRDHSLKELRVVSVGSSTDLQKQIRIRNFQKAISLCIQKSP